MSEDPMDEVVAWIPRATFESSEQAEHGFSPPSPGFLEHAVAQARWSPRRELEDDPSRKQLIPYVVLLGAQGIWTMRRKSAQTETRLHGKASFGVGGHVEETGPNFLENGMRRELHEEVAIEGGDDYPLHFAGTINDDTNDVGAVHLGFVFVAQVGDRDVSIREVEKMHGSWTPIDALDDLEGPMETWSKLLLEHIPHWVR